MKRTRYVAAMIFLTVVPGSYLALAQQTAPNAPTACDDLLRDQRGVGQRREPRRRGRRRRALPDAR